MSYLRPYQIEARDSATRELSNGSMSTLVVLPTGCGKTETALDIIDQWPDQDCDILCLAHREELVWQPWERWEKKTGQYAGIEIAENKRSLAKGRSRVTFASKDSLYPERLRAAFPDPHKVGLIWVDEAHHLTTKNKSYQHILDYFMSANSDCRLLGVTATPDRADEVALGQVFDSVAYDFPLLDPDGGPSAIGDGWLVPLQQEFVTVEDLDFDLVGTRGGDFVDGQLEKMLLEDKPLYRITSATMEIAVARTTLCFAAGINQAINEAVIFNAARDGSAYAIASRVDKSMEHPFVIASQDKLNRRRTLKRWGQGEFQYFCNVGVFTEGMDEPRIACISMGRPTKSRSLYAQMAGRGTRVLSGVIEGRSDDGSYWRLDTPEERKVAIAASGKPSVLILDFVGNSRHSLMSVADILGGRYPDEVVEKAKKKTKGPNDVQQALEAAEDEVKQEMERRRKVEAKAKNVQRRKIDPFSVVGAVPTREPGWHKGRKPTRKQKAALEKFKIDNKDIDQMSFWQASKMLDNLIGRSKSGKATYNQCRLLAKYGESPDLSFEQASSVIDKIAKNNWKPLPTPASIEIEKAPF